MTATLMPALSDDERTQVARPQRNPIEIAKMLKHLADKYGLNHAQLAVHSGRRRSTVSNYLRLLSLPLMIQDSISDGSISMGHAKLLLSLTTRELQIALHARMVREKLSVREAVAIAKKEEQKRDQSADQLHYRALAEELQDHFGTRVEVNARQIILHYHDFDDLQRLIEQMKVLS